MPSRPSPSDLGRLIGHERLVGEQVFYQPSDLATMLIGNLLAIPVESG